MDILGINTGGLEDSGTANLLVLQFQAVLCDLPEVIAGKKFKATIFCRLQEKKACIKLLKGYLDKKSCSNGEIIDRNKKLRLHYYSTAKGNNNLKSFAESEIICDRLPTLFNVLWLNI
jgi:hypothetical protein